MIPAPCAFNSAITRNRRSTSLSLSEAVGSSMMTMRASAPGPGQSRRAAARASTNCGPPSPDQSRRQAARAGRGRARRAFQRHRPPRLLALEPDRDVFGDSQVREEGRLLIDRRDTELARLHRIEVLDQLALDFDRSVVRKMRPVITLISVDLPAPFSPTSAGCLILDVRMPGASGLHLQQYLMESGNPKPIIFLRTGHGDIPMTVQAMKAGAVDFLTKPVRDQTLLDAVTISNVLRR